MSIARSARPGAGAGDVLAAARRVEIALAVVRDHAAVHRVGDGRHALQAAHGRVRRERGQILLAVVVDPFGVAVDVFVEAFALLAERRVFLAGGRRRRVLVALRVLAHFDAIALDQDRALRDDDVARRDGDLFQVVIGQVVRFDVDRLVAVGLFGVGCGREAASGAATSAAATIARAARRAPLGNKQGNDSFMQSRVVSYLGWPAAPPDVSEAAIVPRTLP